MIGEAAARRRARSMGFGSGAAVHHNAPPPMEKTISGMLGVLWEVFMDVVIEDGVPLPGRRTERKDYPHGRMEVGQSFLSQRDYASESALAYRMGKLHGMKFSVRKVEGGVRVWRTV